MQRSSLRVTSVIASLTAGGIGPVCRYAADGMARLTDWQATILSLHDPVAEIIDKSSSLRIVCLGLAENSAPSFLRWLSANPQDVIITSDVCLIEPAFRFLPEQTLHVVQVHDSGRRYRNVAVRHAAWINGVVCVGKHIEAPLRHSLGEVGFRGLVRTVHNGARFPPTITRQTYYGPLRLLFMGRVEALKGAFDLVPLLQRLRCLGVPVRLSIVGGDNEVLRRRLQRRNLDASIIWMGRVPHEQCYAIAAESDVFLMTSRKEPFGMVTIEAMSMGCVPFAYDVPSGSTEIIENGKSGLLIPLGDIRTWADQVRVLHEDRQRLATLSAAAIQRARTSFDATTMAQNLATFVSDLISHSQIHPPTRDTGMPAESPAVRRNPVRGYQRIPAALREWIRNRVHANARISYWLLNR